MRLTQSIVAWGASGCIYTYIYLGMYKGFLGFDAVSKHYTALHCNDGKGNKLGGHEPCYFHIIVSCMTRSFWKLRFGYIPR